MVADLSKCGLCGVAIDDHEGLLTGRIICPPKGGGVEVPEPKGGRDGSAVHRRR